MVNVILYYIIYTDMQIIKTTMILAFLAVIASIGVQQTAKATSDVFKVKVVLTDVDSATRRTSNGRG
jgi:hypothetical protein